MPLTRFQRLSKSNHSPPVIKAEPLLSSTDNIPISSLPKKRAYLTTKYRPIIKSEPTELLSAFTNPEFNTGNHCTYAVHSSSQTTSTSAIASHFSSHIDETSQLSPALIAETLSLLETNSDQFYRQHALAYLYERSASALLRFRYLSLDALLSSGETPKVSQSLLTQQTTASSKLPPSAHSACDCIQCALQIIHRRFCPICNQSFSDKPLTQTEAYHCNCSLSDMRFSSGNPATHDSHSFSSLFRSLAIPDSLLRRVTELERARFRHSNSETVHCCSPISNGTSTIDVQLDSSTHNFKTTNGHSLEDHLSPLRVLPSRACKQPQPPPQADLLAASRRPPLYSFRLTRKRIKRELYMPFAYDERRFLHDEFDLVPPVVAALIARRSNSRQMVLRPHHSAPAVHSSSAIHSAPAVHSSSAIHSAPAVHSSSAIHSAPATHSSSALRSCETLGDYPSRKNGRATQWLSRQRQRQHRRVRSRLNAPDWSSVQYLSVASANAVSSNRRERAQRHAMRTGARARGNFRVASARSNVN